MSHISVLGSGSWATALAIQLAKNEQKVVIWGRNSQTIETINQKKYPIQKKWITLSSHITGTTNIDQAMNKAEGVLLCVPAKAFEDVLNKIKISPSFFAWATKGFSQENDLLSKKVSQYFGFDGAFITGPTFAEEVMLGKPTAVLIAGNQKQTEFWKTAFHNPDFRPYTSKDIIGAQIGATMKNIIAIATGIADGLNYGSNARAALITRGFKEISKINQFFGGKQETLYGLSGIGDVILTSTDNLSRNRRYGMSLAKNQPFGELAEGVHAVNTVHNIGQKNNLDLPVCEAVYQIIKGNIAPQIAAQKLFQRETKME